MRKIKLDLSKFKFKMPKLKKENSDNLGLKKYKLNKEKVKKRLPLVIGLILIMVALAVFPNTLSRYASSGTSGTNINVAYSLLDVVQTENNTIVDTVKLPEVNPDGNSNDFNFEVRNFKVVQDEVGNDVTKIINVKMRYYIEITVTTNLPMTYNLEVTPYGQPKKTFPEVKPSRLTCGPCSDESAANTTNGLYCDSHHTYYYKFTFPTDISDPSKYLTMTYGNTMADLVTLHYSLPESYNSSAYQDIIEMLSIKIHAEQYVKDK